MVKGFEHEGGDEEELHRLWDGQRLPDWQTLDVEHWCQGVEMMKMRSLSRTRKTMAGDMKDEDPGPFEF